MLGELVVIAKGGKGVLTDRLVETRYQSVRQLLLSNDVSAMLSDRGQDGRGDPLLESLGFLAATLQDCCVEARLVDDRDFPALLNAGIRPDRHNVRISFIVVEIPSHVFGFSI